jgi:hypothetical protein
MSTFQLGKKLWHAREVNTNAVAVMAAVTFAIMRSRFALSSIRAIALAPSARIL